MTRNLKLNKKTETINQIVHLHIIITRISITVSKANRVKLKNVTVNNIGHMLSNKLSLK